MSEPTPSQTIRIFWFNEGRMNESTSVMDRPLTLEAVKAKALDLFPG